jgi:hypothetical protein
MNELAVCPDLSPEAESYLRLLGSVAPLKGAAYVAVPITTGPRFLRWYADHGARIEGLERYAEEHRRSVVEPNCADAILRVAAIRKALLMPVIDPASFDRPGWSQEEYRDFWAAVIRRYAAMVIFLEGWQYSSGCSFEFLTATAAGVATLGEHLQPLSQTEGYELIISALSEFHSQGLAASFLESVLQRLKPRYRGQDGIGRARSERATQQR